MRYMNGQEPKRFLRQIEAEGVEFSESTDLEERLLVSANWRSHFIRMIARGNFWHPKTLAGKQKAPAIKAILASHGFDAAQTAQAMNSLGIADFDPSQPCIHAKMAA